MSKIYFDHSATTPVDKRVADIMCDHLLNGWGNPSSVHAVGRQAKESMDTAHAQVANVINCHPEEIFFTSGGTEADNLAIIGYALMHRDRKGHIITSNIEHPAIENAVEYLEKLGFEATRVAADQYGMIHPADISAALRPDTFLVSIMHVNNEVGTINNIGAIGRLLREKGIAFHTDAVQSFGKVPVDVEEMCIDMLSLSGHKIYGPKGVGALYVRKGLEIEPRVFGGHQEMGVRAGTENMPGIVGLGKAAEICKGEMAHEAEYLTKLRDRLHARIAGEVDNIVLNGHTIHRLPGNLNLTFHGVEGEALLMTLDVNGISVSSGSACSSGSTLPSRVLLNIGLTPQEAHSSLRMTLGRENTPEDIDFAAGIIIDSVKNLRDMAGVA